MAGSSKYGKADVPYGTLDLLILKSLETLGEMHGYRIARRIEQVSGDLLHLNPVSICPRFSKLWVRSSAPQIRTKETATKFVNAARV